jgi:glycerol-3-phosphate dehydrogenase
MNRSAKRDASPRNQDAFDLLVVGGGINGAGIARDAAGRGLSVLLCEQDDLAAHTSSASTKLIHGGLRYLEFYDFGLVRKALKEREVLLAAAPHILWPLRFVLPHDAHLRPAWMIRAGLFLYDHLTRRRLLEGSAAVDFSSHPAGPALDPRFRRGFVYSDGWVDDARLVVLNALDAQERGAVVLTRTRCEQLQPEGAGWRALLRSAAGEPRSISARAVVNATGPWAAEFLNSAAPGRSDHALRLVKGSHIVVPRLFDHEYAYICQSPDRRIVFAIPYETDFTLIGTTDIDYHGAPGAVHIDSSEIDYLCTLANQYFRRAIGPADVVWSYSGVRPLLDDESTDARRTTRDYALELGSDPAPLLTVFGGKITTYRLLAEEALDRLAPLLGATGPAWTEGATLPGGDMPGADFAAFEAGLQGRHPWLPAGLRHRYARAYGTRIEQLLAGAASLSDLGPELAPQLYTRELEYLCRVEWAHSAEDILWRRSKLGLHLAPAATTAVQAWLDARATAEPSAPPRSTP